MDASQDCRHHARQVPGVAYQGEPGAFSEMAARVLFRDGISTLPRRRLQAVTDAVVRGEASFGVVPVENSSVGGVSGAYDVLASGPLEVVAEVVLPVRLALLAPEGANLHDVQGVRSHPVALAQCDGFLDTHGLEPRACHDTAGAAREVAEAADTAVAAVASRAAARQYGLRVLADGIQDRPDNRTRFLLVAPRGEGLPVDGPDGSARKTLLWAQPEDRPGALVEILRPFADRSVDVRRIEPRPWGQAWQYRFFLELAGDAAEAPVGSALEAARASNALLHLLGSYPVWRPGRSGDPPEG